MGPGRCNTYWDITPGSVQDIPIFPISAGVSIYISKQPGVWGNGILQFEYTPYTQDGFFYDLSDIDGSGPGLSGSIFANDNVLITPNPQNWGFNLTGKAAPAAGGNCKQVNCQAGLTCADAYQHPSDNQVVHVSPLSL